MERLFACVCVATAFSGAGGDTRPLRLSVSDPLAAENACACVAGYAHRNYRMLGEVLAKELGRPVEVVVASTVESARTRLEGQPDVMIGKASEIEAEGRPGLCLARLTDTRGGVVFQGVLVVRSDDTAQRVADVAGYRLLFGPATCAEKHEAAFELMRTFGCAVPDKPETADTCTFAARQVAESGQGGRGVAAFISDYALPLLVGCETVDPGTLRVIGRTGPVPFIGAYASGHLPKEEAVAVQAALLAVSRRSRLRKALESRDGFVRPDALPAESVAEPADLPEKLPETLAVRWRRALSAQSLGGLAGRARYLIVSDKDDAETSDVWRCLDAATGQPIWEVAYPAAGQMDYTGAPRATPVIEGERVYLLGAFGDLVCAELATGRVVWRCQLLKKYGGTLPTWGFCGTPLVVGGRVVVQTASPKAALVALDGATGREVWRTSGEGPGYGSLVHVYVGGRWQIVGHEAAALRGWDAGSGKPLWRVVPPEPHDFNVPTPMRVGEFLLAATENNGTRLYAFDEEGVIRPEPVVRTEALSPQIATPVRVGNRIWGQREGGVVELELGRTLRPLGVWEDAAFAEYAALVAGVRRILAVSKTGDLFLFPARAESGFQPERRTVFAKRPDGAPVEVWSQPVVLNGCLYVRSQDEVVCLSLRPDAHNP